MSRSRGGKKVEVKTSVMVGWRMSRSRGGKKVAVKTSVMVGWGCHLVVECHGFGKDG